MYEYIDTNEFWQGDTDLPAEAMSFNGVYFEHVIKGYRTLSVSGREGIETEVTDLTIGTTDGSQYQRRRDQPRTIKVKFQLLAESAEDFRAAFNTLSGYLRAEQAKIIFADEPDKYFVGTKTNVGDIDEGKNYVTGTIEIYCADPYKYAVDETVVKAVPAEAAGLDAAAEISYDGTYPAKPILEAVMGSETGYLGFLDQRGHMICFGNSDTGDETPADQSVLMIDVRDGNFGTSELARWTKNQAPMTLFGQSSAQVGTVGIVQDSTHGQYAQMTAKGTNDSVVWLCSTLTRPLGTDSSGSDTAKNFKLYERSAFIAGSYKQAGAMAIMLTTKDGKNVAGLKYLKNNQADGLTINLIIAGNTAGTLQTSCSDNTNINRYFHWPSGQHSIQKSGANFSFYVDGQYRNFTMSSAANLEAYSVTVCWAGLKKYSLPTVFGLRALTVRKDNVTVDIPNVFSAGSTFTADTATGDVRLNGIRQYGLGDITNDWEDFAITPGTNIIKCNASTWTKADPTFKIRYRKVYI